LIPCNDANQLEKKMSYVQDSLTKGETIVYQGHVSLWSMAFSLVMGVILLPSGLGVLILLLVFVRYRSTELAITNKRIIAKFGFVRRDTVELSLARVESVQIRQGVWGRLFGYGSLVVSGAGAPQAPIPGVSSPMVFRAVVFEAQEEAQSQVPLKHAA
jgi:uncharacterized membrane protein YdbT with pleckstrin-like domain